MRRAHRDSSTRIVEQLELLDNVVGRVFASACRGRIDGYEKPSRRCGALTVARKVALT
jgi:hypothetical protein